MITKKIRTHRKKSAGQPLEEKENHAVSGIDNRKKDAELRRSASALRKGTADLRQQAGNLRQGSASQREATADQREDIADLRQDTADNREDIADLREEAADQRQSTADLQQDTADLRQITADLREDAADHREKAARAKAILSASTQALLREANERLVVATVHAQTMTAAAELITAQMTHMAEHDFLTGLPNRALLTARLEQSIALAQRHGKKVALMFMDVDHFKHINDSLGHAVGDQLLQSVARRLQECIQRHSDTISRQGGDEFVVLLSEVEDLRDAGLTAKKLLKAVANPHLVGDHRLHVTLSIGISHYPDDGKDSETLLSNADSAMYHAKKSGRNNYKMFTPDLNLRAVARLSMVQALHKALEEQDFVLHYQPKVNIETRAITGAEALIRWRRSERRTVRPAQFVSIAEECGLILPIGKWVLREACRQTQAWLQAGLDPGLIAINVSAVEFHNKDFLAGVLNILSETGLDPHHLEFELTESGLMQDTEQTMVILRTLKSLGAQIAVDDFGTGYSSLSYLWRFPIDELKIDRSFVQSINSNDGNGGETIVSAVIAMGVSLKQRVVAEGIETRNQLDFLQSHHCAEGQGFYFSRPVPADKFATLLARNR